ncbi:MAG: DUF421 domain-containing protein [Chloroflexia bacterium]|nr:DUF421 domain-containing protein [Chloroflexia bacterium]
MENLFFSSWQSLLRTLISGFVAYFLLVVFLRISGKRTLSKLNAFDLVITVALGSTLATILLNKSVALADGIVALLMLIFFQFIITWWSVRSKKISKAVKSSPSVLYYRGEFYNSTMEKERVTKDEIIAAARQNGIDDIERVKAVFLETDGSLSVINM